MKKTIMEFSGSPSMLINMLENFDFMGELQASIDDAKKVHCFIYADEDEPYYVPPPDDIQITQMSENIRSSVDLGEPVQVVDDLHYDEVAVRELWSEDDEKRMDVVGSNGPSGLHYLVNGDEHDSEVIGA